MKMKIKPVTPQECFFGLTEEEADLIVEYVNNKLRSGIKNINLLEYALYNRANNLKRTAIEELILHSFADVGWNVKYEVLDFNDSVAGRDTHETLHHSIKFEIKENYLL
jgi:hypothetical protein